jgi:uncharacterized membrane protein YphA (DoxX/SURF4 family)
MTYWPGSVAPAFLLTHRLLAPWGVHIWESGCATALAAGAAARAVAALAAGVNVTETAEIAPAASKKLMQMTASLDLRMIPAFTMILPRLSAPPDRFTSKKRETDIRHFGNGPKMYLTAY